MPSLWTITADQLEQRSRGPHRATDVYFGEHGVPIGDAERFSGAVRVEIYAPEAGQVVVMDVIRSGPDVSYATIRDRSGQP